MAFTVFQPAVGAVSLLILLLSHVSVVRALPKQLYVSPEGTGTTCTSSQPCTLASVRNLIQHLKATTSLPPGGIYVNVMAGDYAALSSSVPVLALQGDMDSGTPATPITYSGVGSQTRLMGGTVVPSSAFKPFSGLTPEQSSLPLLQADLKALGLHRFGRLESGGLGACTNKRMTAFFKAANATRASPMILARYPNIAPDGKWQWLNVQGVTGPLSFQYPGTRPASWASAPDPWAHGYWAYGWADNHVKLASINVTTATINVDPATPPLYKIFKPARFYGENILSELDAPGEYYINTTTGVLYIYPPADISTSEVVVSQLDAIVSLDSVSYVTIANMTASFAQGTGVTATNVSHVVFSGMDMSLQGRDGATLTGSNSRIEHSVIMDVGCKGISTNGGDEATLSPGNLVIHNNTIARFSGWKRTYNPAIGFSGVGNNYTFNNMYNGPHTGVQGEGNNHMFANNNFTDMCYEVTDAGAWYSGRSWAHRGSYLVNNTFLRIRNTETTYLGSPAVNCIYLDDQLSGHFVYGNKMIDSHQAILLGGGRRHQIHNNTFINVVNGISMDDRGLTWQKEYCAVGGKFEQELEAVHYQQPPWSTAYPNLPFIMKEYPCVPVYNNIYNNVYCNGTFINESKEQVTSWHSSMTNNVEACP